MREDVRDAIAQERVPRGRAIFRFVSRFSQLEYGYRRTRQEHTISYCHLWQHSQEPPHLRLRSLLAVARMIQPRDRKMRHQLGELVKLPQIIERIERAQDCLPESIINLLQENALLHSH